MNIRKKLIYNEYNVIKNNALETIIYYNTN